MAQVVVDGNAPQLPQKLGSIPDNHLGAMPKGALEQYATIETLLKQKGRDGHYSGGLVYEAVELPDGSLQGIVHIGNPFQKSTPLDIVTIPTRCTQAQVDKIKKQIMPMEESYEILSALAMGYKMHTPVMIEGETSIGKTWLVKKFMEIIYGPDASPVHFNCNGQTDVSELMGKWVPAGNNSEEAKHLNNYLLSSKGQEVLNRLDITIGEGGVIDLSDDQCQALSRETGFPIRERGWSFQYGAVPSAMTACVGEDGRISSVPYYGGNGTILNIDEVGIAEPAVVNALLRIRGEQGRLAETIQLWENGGEKIHAGPDYWVVFTTNPPEKGYLSRKEIDPALARGVLWLRFGDLSSESMKIACQKIFTYQLGDAGDTRGATRFIDLQKNPKIGREIAEIVAAFHESFKAALAKGETGGRRQKIPVTLDHLSRLAAYMNSQQVPYFASRGVDLAETLRRGVNLTYLKGLADEKLKQDMSTALEMLLTSDTLGTKRISGTLAKRADILNTMACAALSVSDSQKETGAKTASSAGGSLPLQAEMLKRRSTFEGLCEQVRGVLLNRALDEKSKVRILRSVSEKLKPEEKLQLKETLEGLLATLSGETATELETIIPKIFPAKSKKK